MWGKGRKTSNKQTCNYSAFYKQNFKRDRDGWSKAGGGPGHSPSFPLPPWWSYVDGAGRQDGVAESGPLVGPWRSRNLWGLLAASTGESSGGVLRAMPGGIRGVEEGARLPSGIILSHCSGRSRHSGGIVICSPGSSRSSGVVEVLGSGPNQHSGEVSGHSLGSGTRPGGFNPPFPGTSVSGTSGLGSEEPGVHNSGCNLLSGSTCLHPHKPCEDRTGVS